MSEDWLSDNQSPYSELECEYEYEFTTDDEMEPLTDLEPPATTPVLLYDHLAASYMDFTDKNPTTYHAIAAFQRILDLHGFTQIPEKKALSHDLAQKIAAGGLFYSIRSNLSIVAFAVGANWVPENGVGAIGSHVDALTVKLKPISKTASKNGYRMLAVAPYSGSLNKLWLDRDLHIGGRVIYKTPEGKVKAQLVQSDFPVAKIPSLAEHFVDFEKQKYDKETKMVPIIGYETGEPEDVADDEVGAVTSKHSIHLLRLVSQLSGIRIADMLELDLELYDGQSSSRGGLNSEFVFAPRVDDRLCSFTALYALINYSKTVSLDKSNGFQLVDLVDNEEIGSLTRTGENGTFLNAVVQRVMFAKKVPLSLLSTTFANSFILSADVTHALNPNFASSYLKNHAPLPNTGLTVKLNSNWKNMTDSTGLDVMRRIAEKNNLTLQTFYIKNGEPSGGTIGPMISTHTGSRTVDVGLAQLSMHSIRATFGYKEVGIGIDTFSAFFRDWQNIYKEYQS